MAKTTRATQALDKAKVAYEVVAYDYDPDADRIGDVGDRCVGGRVVDDESRLRVGLRPGAVDIRVEPEQCRIFQTSQCRVSPGGRGWVGC